MISNPKEFCAQSGIEPQSLTFRLSIIPLDHQDHITTVKHSHKMSLPVMQAKDSVHPDNESNDVV